MLAIWLSDELVVVAEEGLIETNVRAKESDLMRVATGGRLGSMRASVLYDPGLLCYCSLFSSW